MVGGKDPRSGGGCWSWLGSSDEVVGSLFGRAEKVSKSERGVWILTNRKEGCGFFTFFRKCIDLLLFVVFLFCDSMIDHVLKHFESPVSFLGRLVNQ